MELKLFHDQSPQKYGTVLGSYSGPLYLQSDMLPTAIGGLAKMPLAIYGKSVNPLYTDGFFLLV